MSIFSYCTMHPSVVLTLLENYEVMDFHLYLKFGEYTSKLLLIEVWKLVQEGRWSSERVIFR